MSAVATDIVEEILELKRERNAVILAHNYQVGQIQELADYVGDSLGFSYKAAEDGRGCDRLLRRPFHGGDGEDREPEEDAWSFRTRMPAARLAESCPPEELAAYPRAHAEKNYYVIAYINCSAGVKALSDVICTSGNAVKIVKRAPKDRNILFVPDENLGAWVMEQTGRQMELWQGNCYVHVEFTRDSIERIRSGVSGRAGRRAPGMHLRRAHAGRRSLFDGEDDQLLQQTSGEAFIIVTESGMLHRLRREDARTRRSSPGRPITVPAPTAAT